MHDLHRPLNEPPWRTMLRSPYYPALLAPVLIMVALAFASYYFAYLPYAQGDAALPRSGQVRRYFKILLEQAAVIILAVALGFSVLRGLIRRRGIDLWIAALCLTFLMREIHWRWMEGGVYAMLLALILVTNRRFAAIRPCFEQRAMPTLLACAAVSYVLSIMLDQRMFKGIPGENEFELITEESMECVGHLFVLAATIFLRDKPAPALDAEKAAESRELAHAAGR